MTTHSHPSSGAMIDALLSIHDVSAMTRLSKSTIYAWISEDTFPAPYALGPKCVRWKQSEVQQWMAGLKRSVG